MKEKDLKYLIENSHDLHKEIASKVFKVSTEEVTPEMRKSVKAGIYPYLYNQNK